MRLLFSQPGKWILLSCFFLLGLAGCSDEQSMVSAPKTSPPPSARKIVIGLIPEMDIFAQQKRYGPVALYLSQKTGAVVELKILSRYGNIVNNFQNADMDGAFLGSFTGMLAIKKLGLEPLVRPESENGSSTYSGIVFARKDQAIRTALDMKGKVFVFVDKATTAGWLLPLCFFQMQGIKDYRTWFKETYFSGTHEDAINDVLHGKANLGVAKDSIFDLLAEKNPRITQELEILMTSPQVPGNTLFVRPGLDPVLKSLMKKTLLAMDHDPEGRRVLAQFGARRFVVTVAEDYVPVIKYAEHIGLDLKKYDYNNH